MTHQNGQEGQQSTASHLPLPNVSRKAGATTKALLGNLARQIKLIDTDTDHAPVARDVAASVMAELCNRYRITLPLQ